MSWFTLALGLIREAAGTDVGQDIINDMRSGASRGQPKPDAEPGPPPTDAWRRSVEGRFDVAGRNTEMLVRMLNAQHEVLNQIQKRQRIWNVCLAAGILLTAGGLIWLWFR